MCFRSKRNLNGIHPTASLFMTGGLMLALLTGCEGKKPGPKREDHERAHKAIYHPDVDRSRPSSPSTTQPAVVQEDLSARPDARRQKVLFVNGRTIIVADILEPIVEDLRKATRDLPLSEYVKYAQREVLREIQSRISHIVVYEEARREFEHERFQKLFEREANDTMLKLIRNRYGGARARYEKHLAEFDMSYDDALQRAKEQSMAYNYLRRKFEFVRRQPTRREIMRYYETHIDAFTTPARAQPQLIEIMFKDPDGKPLPESASDQEKHDARQRARQRAKQALDELAAGIPFESVAKTYSDGIRASRGGLWDEVQPNGMVKRWALACDALFKLDQGQVSDLIETPVSFFIVRCASKTPASRESFEDAQAEIVRRLQEEQFEDWSRQYITNLVDQAGIPSEDKLAFAAEVLVNCPLPPGPDQAQDVTAWTP